MRITRYAAIAGGRPACVLDRLRQRRRQPGRATRPRPPQRSRPTPSSSAGTTMAELAEAGDDHGRHQVRPARLRPGQPRRRARGLRRRDRQDHRRRSSASQPRTSRSPRPSSANREAFIESGKVDIVVATYTINDERKELIDFAGPYYEAGQDIMVAPGTTTPSRARRPRRQDRLLGRAARRRPRRSGTEYPEAEAGRCSTPTPSAPTPCANGQVDAVTTDNVILAGFVAGEPDGAFELVGEPFTEEPYGIGVTKGDDEFRDFINDVLEESYEDGYLGRGVGRHRRRHQRHRGSRAARRSTATDRPLTRPGRHPAGPRQAPPLSR